MSVKREGAKRETEYETDFSPLSKHVLWDSNSPFRFQLSAPVSSLPAGTLTAPSTPFPLMGQGFGCIFFFLSQPLLVVYLLSIEFHSSTSGTTCSDVILCHLSFPDLQISGVKKEKCLWPQKWECLKMVAHNDYAVYTAGLNWNQNNGWIWSYLVSHTSYYKEEKMLHTGIFTSCALRSVNIHFNPLFQV